MGQEGEPDSGSSPAPELFPLLLLVSDLGLTKEDTRKGKEDWEDVWNEKWKGEE